MAASQRLRIICGVAIVSSCVTMAALVWLRSARLNEDNTSAFETASRHKHLETIDAGPLRERGTIDRHLFLDLCGSTVDAGRKSPKYPFNPDRRDQLVEGVLRSSIGFDNYFQRIFGYLHPDVSGSYIFAIACDDHCELWLGTDDRASSESLVAFVGAPSSSEGDEWTRPDDFNAFPSQQSVPIELEAGKRYWIEVLHIQGGGAEHVSVAWKVPSSNGFVIMPTSNTSPFFSADSVSKGLIDDNLPANVPSHVHRSRKPTGNNVADNPKNDARDAFFRLPFASVADALATALPQCNIPLSYPRPAYIERYGGVRMVVESVVYPKDGTAMLKGDKFESENGVMTDSDAQRVVSEYVTAVNTRLGESNRSLLQLVSIVNVVQKRHAVGENPGFRFLVELEVRQDGNDKLQRVSQYVYLPDGARSNEQYGGSRLCASPDFAWNPHAKVHIVIAVKNQGAWVRHLVADVEQLLRETGDRNFRLILVDFDSVDIDVEAHLAASQLPRDMWHVVKRTGSFERAGGIQSGVDAVTSPDDIVFLCDLHLEMPRTIIENVRRYTVRGRKVYAPAVVRLACGHTPDSPNGFWEMGGYGLLALYKADYDRIGGMNTNEYKSKWGGEDWEFMDRVFTSGFEVERLRLAKFYHFFHSQRGMWTAAGRR
eukprot:Opistho-2@49508